MEDIEIDVSISELMRPMVLTHRRSSLGIYLLQKEQIKQRFSTVYLCDIDSLCGKIYLVILTTTLSDNKNGCPSQLVFGINRPANKL